MTTLIKEAISAASFPRASLLIKKYLRKNLGTNAVYLYPIPEHVKSNGKTLVGIRFFIHNKESLRFNWLSDGSISDSKNLMSVDYWDGTTAQKPSHRIAFDSSQSLVKTLPMIVDFVSNPFVGTTLWVPETMSLVESTAKYINEGASFSNITEARQVGYNVIESIPQLIKLLGSDIKTVDIRNMPDAKQTLMKVHGAVREVYPHFFTKDGKSLVFINPANAKKIDKQELINFMGGNGAVKATVTRGAVETYVASKETEALEENMPRLAYEEQLLDLAQGVSLLMNNATNALFVAGRGGTGKTETVEQELSKRGLSDGNGYFKITGSASASGIYSILYKHRKDLLFFDDCDGALLDQDARNLFKSASDTKKVRKISWLKMGGNYVDPDDIDDDNEDGKLPRYFDFTGKIMFISNLKLDKLDPDGALRTRGYIMTIDPLDTEIYAFMEKIMGKIKLDVDYELSKEQRLDVINILRGRRGKEGSANIRQMVRGLNTAAGILKDGGKDYRNMVLRYA